MLSKKTYSILIVIFFLCSQKNVCAQNIRKGSNDTIPSIRNLQKIIANFWGGDLGFEYEKKISRKSSLTLFGGMTFFRESEKYADLHANIIGIPTPISKLICLLSERLIPYPSEIKIL